MTMKLHWDAKALVGPIGVFDDGRWVLITPAFNEGPHPVKVQDYLFADIEPMSELGLRILADSLNWKDNDRPT